MKNLFLSAGLVFILLLSACDEYDDLNGYTYYSENTIYSSSSETQFREVLFTIRPYIKLGDDHLYILTDTLLNVSVKMNNTQWCLAHSLDMDTAAVVKTSFLGFAATPTQLKYSIIAAYEPKKDTLTTAGEYADLLRTHLLIEPGVYFCRVESFDLKKIDGSLFHVVPYISEMIEINEDTRSIFLGDFEVMVSDMSIIK